MMDPAEREKLFNNMVEEAENPQEEEPMHAYENEDEFTIQQLESAHEDHEEDMFSPPEDIQEQGNE